MADMLGRNGYATHGIGKWHCGMYTWAHTPAQRGFDKFFGLYLGRQGYFSHKNKESMDLRDDYYDQDGNFVDHMRTDLTGVYNTHPEDFVEKLSSIIPMGRMADIDEYKGAIAFLCSDASSYMTGTNLIIDGGKTIW